MKRKEMMTGLKLLAVFAVLYDLSRDNSILRKVADQIGSAGLADVFNGMFA